MIKEHNVEAVLMICSETTPSSVCIYTQVQVEFVYSVFGAKGNNHVL